MAGENTRTFFSYAREDSEFVLRLVKRLRDAGADVWLDQLDIGPGKHWDTEVEKALLQCPRTLIVLSPASVNSPNVMDEVSYALEQKKEVIPLLYQDCSIPFRLRRLQWIDLRADDAGAFKQLLAALMTGKQTEFPAHSQDAADQAAMSRQSRIAEGAAGEGGRAVSDSGAAALAKAPGPAGSGSPGVIQSPIPSATVTTGHVSSLGTGVRPKSRRGRWLVIGGAGVILLFLLLWLGYFSVTNQTGSEGVSASPTPAQRQPVASPTAVGPSRIARPTPSSTPSQASSDLGEAKSYFLRGADAFNKKDYDRAITSLTRAIALNPNYAQAYVARANAYSYKGDYGRSIQDYSQALSFNPHDASLYIERGRRFSLKEAWVPAIQDFSQALKLKPDSGDAYYGRGIAYFYRQDYAPAIQDLTQALPLIDNWEAKSMIYYSRGRAYEQAGDLNNALQDYASALKLNPDLSQARQNRDRVILKMRPRPN